MWVLDAQVFSFTQSSFIGNSNWTSSTPKFQTSIQLLNTSSSAGFPYYTVHNKIKSMCFDRVPIMENTPYTYIKWEIREVDEYSVEVWLYLQACAGNIMNIDDGGANPGIWINNNFSLTLGPSKLPDETPTGKCKTKEWTHIVAVFDGYKLGRVFLYTNGVLTLNSSSQYMDKSYFRKWISVNRSKYNTWFTGCFGQMQLWEKVVLQEEVQQLYSTFANAVHLPEHKIRSQTTEQEKSSTIGYNLSTGLKETSTNYSKRQDGKPNQKIGGGIPNRLVVAIIVFVVILLVAAIVVLSIHFLSCCKKEKTNTNLVGNGQPQNKVIPSCNAPDLQETCDPQVPRQSPAIPQQETASGEGSALSISVSQKIARRTQGENL